MSIRKVPRWSLRSIMVVALGLLMVVGLSPAADSEQPQQVERLTIATEADKGNLTPYSFSPPPGLHSELTGLVYDTLFLSPFTEEPIPWLATEAEASEDARTWTVTLRDGVAWHDGEEFTAEDVAFTYEYYREGPPNRYSHHVSDVPTVETIEALDPTTVEFTCEDPCPTLDLVTLADLPILPEHVWEEVEDPMTYTELPVGTGPYELVEYTEDQSYRFEANEDYFLGAPAVGEIDMPIVPDPSSMFLSLETGEVDSATLPLPPEVRERFEENEDAELVDGERFSSAFYIFNDERPPLDQPEFRNALDMAIDRQELVDTVLLGQGREGSPSFMHPDSFWFNSQEAEFDPDRAEEILDEIGVSDSSGDGVRELDGEPLSLSILVPANDPQRIRAAELITQQLEEIGLELESESVDPGTLGSRTFGGDFDLSSYEGVPHLLGDPDQMIESLDSLLTYPNPEYEGLRSEWFETTTIEDRREALNEIQELFVEDPPAFTLYYPDTYYGYNADVYEGWMPVNGHGIHHKWSFVPEAAEMLDEERVSQTAPAEEAGGGALPYVLVGVGAVAVLGILLFLWLRSNRETGEDEI